MSLAKWHEVADSKSPATSELKPGLSWAADLGVLEFNGLEAAKFLQGYLTCDTEALLTGQWQPTALCNLKGRVVANGWVSVDDHGSLWLLVHRSLAEHCLTFLHKYLVFAKAQGHNRSDSLVVIMSYQQAAAPTDALNSANFATSPDTRLSLVHVDQAIERWQQAPFLNSSTQFNTMLLAAGMALVTHYSSEQYLPQMLGLADSGAIDFDKGCYLGQEIVARAQHRGTVKRQLVRLEWQQDALTANNLDAAELMDSNNRSLGKIINWQVATDGTGAFVGSALAVVNSKDGVLPSTASSNVDAGTTTADAPVDAVFETATAPIVFQVHQIEN